MLGLGLALCSSLCWGVADFIGGVQSRRMSVLRVVLISQAIGLGWVIVALVIRGKGPPGFERMLAPIGGGVAGIVGLVAFYRALAIGTMSIVAPIAATGVAVPVIVGIAGGDRPAALQFAGIIAATIGVVLASREAEPEELAGLPPSRLTLGLSLVAALGFGTFFVGLRAGARVDVLWTLFSSRGAAVSALLGAVLALGPADRISRRSLLALAVVGTLDVGANGLFALASRHGLLSIVAVGSSLYPLATVILARLLLGERVRRVQEAGIAAALAGIVMIAAG